MTLLSTQERKNSWSGAAVDAPGISCKRKDILRLKRDEYEKWAKTAIKGFEWAAEFLDEEGIFAARDIPYKTQLVPLATLRATLGSSIQQFGTIDKIRQWYGNGVLGELYGGAIETRFVRDLEQVVNWVRHGGPPPYWRARRGVMLGHFFRNCAEF